MLPSLGERGQMMVSSSTQNLKSSVIDSDINLANLNRRASEHTVPTRKWQNDKNYENNQKNFLKQLNQRKQHYAAQDLEGVYERYAAQRAEQDHRGDAAKWEHVFLFVQLVEARLRRKLPLAGYEKALYEATFRHEPRRLINEPRFLTVMREVYGFDIAAGGVKDAPALRRLTGLYRAYTSSRDCPPGGLEWRAFVLATKVVQDPLVFAEEQLRWGFKLFGSQGFFDPDGSTPVPLGEVVAVFGAPVALDRRPEVRRAVDDAWLQVADEDDRAGAAASRAATEGRRQHQVLVTYRMFELMLKSAALALLWEPDVAYGERDLETWTCLYEEQFYHPTLLAYIKAQRRCDRNERRCKEFRIRWGRRIKKNRLKDWKMYTYRRQRGRGLMKEAQERYTTINASEAFKRLKRYTMESVAANHLQRYYRGHWGRSERWFLERVDYLVTLIQSKFRMHRQRKAHRREVMRLNWAATEVQRHTRGNRARRYAARILLNFYDAGMERVARERVEWRTQLEAAAALKLQANWRAKLARRRAILKAEKDRRDAELLAEMRAVENEAERQRRVHMESLERWYQERKAEYDATTISAASNAQVRWQIQQRALADKFRQEERRRQRKADNLAAEEQARVERRFEEWEAKAEAAAQAAVEKLNVILDDPLTKEEKEANREWKKKIKQRSRDVIKQADRDKVEMEWVPARWEARRQLVAEAAEAERERVRAEMRAAAEHEIRDKGLAELQGEWQWYEQEELHTDKAAAQVQKQARRWLARRELRRRAQATFTKHFDPEGAAYFYRNERTGATQWERPKALGVYDVDAPDEWVVMRTHAAGKDLYYYYNMFTMAMERGRPKGTIVCSICLRQFATCYSNNTGDFYCDEHYTEQHAHYERASLSWKLIEGKKSTAKDIDLTKIEDQFDSEARLALPPSLGQGGARRHRVAIEASRAGGVPGGGGGGALVPSEGRGGGGGGEAGGGAGACAMCREAPARRHCHQCQQRYCVDCFMEAHGKGPWKKHTFNNL